MPEIMFAGPAGRLEGRYHLNENPKAPTVLVMHPHPKHGGTMNNKLTHILYRSFAQQGFHALRFNFRGVGKSEGTYDNGEGELNDAASALDWIQYHNTLSNRFWVAGFSFGAWVALQLLMRRPEIEGFIIINPPANLYDFSFLAPCPVVGQVIQTSDDPIVDVSYVDLLVARLRTHKGIFIDYQKIKSSDHFLKSETHTASQMILNFLDNKKYLEKKAVA
jgi:alpha/beta superfamily hydrolase